MLDNMGLITLMSLFSCSLATTRTVVLWRGMPLCLEHAQTPLYYCGIVMSPYSRRGYECSSNSDWCCFCLRDLLLEECCKKSNCANIQAV